MRRSWAETSGSFCGASSSPRPRSAPSARAKGWCWHKQQRWLINAALGGWASKEGKKKKSILILLRAGEVLLGATAWRVSAAARSVQHHPHWASSVGHAWQLPAPCPATISITWGPAGDPQRGLGLRANIKCLFGCLRCALTKVCASGVVGPYSCLWDF